MTLIKARFEGIGFQWNLEVQLVHSMDDIYGIVCSKALLLSITTLPA